MNLLPVPARVPARKHLLAGAVALVSVGLMLVAVLGTAGLPTPFGRSDPSQVRTTPVEVDRASPTPEPELASTEDGAPQLSQDIVTSDGSGTATPSDNSRQTTTTSPSPTTTTTIIPTTEPPPPDDLLDGLGFDRELTQP
jgi:hypothetical protein